MASSARVYVRSPVFVLAAGLASVLASHGYCLLRLGQASDAEPLLRECVSIRERALPGQSPTHNAMSLLGEALAQQGRREEAEPLLVEAGLGLLRGAPPGDRWRREALLRLIDHYAVVGRDDLAADLRLRLEDPPSGGK